MEAFPLAGIVEINPNLVSAVPSNYYIVDANTGTTTYHNLQPQNLIIPGNPTPPQNYWWVNQDASIYHNPNIQMATVENSLSGQQPTADTNTSNNDIYVVVEPIASTEQQRLLQDLAPNNMGRFYYVFPCPAIDSLAYYDENNQLFATATGINDPVLSYARTFFRSDCTMLEQANYHLQCYSQTLINLYEMGWVCLYGEPNI